MRFGRVLHPEIVLGKRGQPFEQKFYKTACSMLQLDKSGVLWSIDPDDPDDLTHVLGAVLEKDSVLVRFLVSCKVFFETKASVYHIGRDFLLALQKVDRQVPVDILPEKFCAYFSFASKTLFDESDCVEGGYVLIDRGSNLGMDRSLADTRIITFSYVCQKASEAPAPPIASLTVPLDAKTLSELAAGAPLEDFLISPGYSTEEKSFKRNEVFRALLNCVIYLHSSEPILQRSLPITETKKSAKEHKRDGEVINACTIPVSFLWPTYELQRTQKVTATWVDSHPRWQRCGPGLSSVKLVFVAAHERKYDKDVESLGFIGN